MKAVKIVDFNDSRSPEAESYRALRTKIKFISHQKGVKTIAITSPNAGDGKTTVCINLAISMAQTGSRVLIVDGNLRNPILHRIFALANDMGLTNIIYTKSTYEDFIKPTVIKNLDILMCGPKPPNPSEMLNFAAVKGILDGMKKDYDYIFIDTAAIVGITDGMLLSSACDGTLLVLVLGETSSNDAIKAMELLKDVDACIIGIVMNKCRQGARKAYPANIRGKNADGYGTGLQRSRMTNV